MNDFPADASLRDVSRAFERLGFTIVRQRGHISMVRVNGDGTRTTLSLPNHNRLKAPTLRTICTRARISREAFREAFYR